MILQQFNQTEIHYIRYYIQDDFYMVHDLLTNTWSIHMFEIMLEDIHNYDWIKALAVCKDTKELGLLIKELADEV